MVGLIVCRDEGGDHAIDIEYHDRGARRPLHRTDPHRSTLGALSTTLMCGRLRRLCLQLMLWVTRASTDEHAVVLASPKRSREGSLLQVLPTGTWATNADWQARLDGDEQVVAVAVGAGWCAAATSAGYLRLYSLAGIPLAVLSVPGALVTIASSGRFLLVAHHRGPPTDRTSTTRTWRASHGCVR
jgi:chromosome transmission fidelity protein 4